MSFAEQLITIAVVVLGTMTTRFLPFLLFPAHKKTPPHSILFREGACNNIGYTRIYVKSAIQ